jgi:hypothetical protein
VRFAFRTSRLLRTLVKLKVQKFKCNGSYFLDCLQGCAD